MKQVQETIGQHYEHIPWPSSGPLTACLLFREFISIALLPEVSLVPDQKNAVLYLLITSHHPRWTLGAIYKITGANTNYNYTNICIDL